MALPPHSLSHPFPSHASHSGSCSVPSAPASQRGCRGGCDALGEKEGWPAASSSARSRWVEPWASAPKYPKLACGLPRKLEVGPRWPPGPGCCCGGGAATVGAPGATATPSGMAIVRGQPRGLPDGPPWWGPWRDGCNWGSGGWVPGLQRARLLHCCSGPGAQPTCGCGGRGGGCMGQFGRRCRCGFCN